MVHFFALTALCFSSVIFAVQGDYEGEEVGSIHAEGRHQSEYSADTAKKELKEMLNGKSEEDILELRNKFKEEKKHHHDSSNWAYAFEGHKKCPTGFGKRPRSDGCCGSEWADDLTQAKYECEDSYHWEVFVGGPDSPSKFTCCPPPTVDVNRKKDSLKKDMDEFKRLVREKDATSKDDLGVGFDAAEDVEAAATPVSSRSHNRQKSRSVSSEIEEEAREEMIARIDEMETVKERDHMIEWQQEARRTAASESAFLTSFLQMLLAIPVVLAVGVGYLVMIGSDLTAVEIPGVGVFNLQKIAKDVIGTIATGKSHVTKFSDFDDGQLKNPVQSSYGSYGGYGGYGSSPAVPSFESSRSNMFSGAGESQALFAAAPAAPPKKSIAMPPVDDLGL